MLRVPGADGRWRWWSALLVLAALVAVFLGVSAIGAVQAARGARVLAFLEPAVSLLTSAGWEAVLWLLAHGSTLGRVITGTATTIVLLGLIVARRRAVPLLLLAGGVSLAAWAQIRLLADEPHSGAWLYALSVACTVALGACCPLARLDGVPQPPQLNGPDKRVSASSPVRLHWRWEGTLIVVLALVGALTRTYALTELPQGFEPEMIDSMLMSRSMWSLGSYFRFGFMANSAGIIHLLPGPMLFGLFGTSLYTVRLEATFFGFLAIPLLYWLLRRMAGVGAAIAATVLMITAPEELYWSRIETGGFIPVAVLALITAHLGWWMVQRFSIAAVLSAALWMPVCRYFYAPGYIMFAYPLLLYAHAVVFVRRAWRKAWYTVPLLVAGLMMWIFSLSIVFSYLNHWQWRFMHPAFIFGAPAWRMHGQPGFRDAGLTELLKLQAVAMLNKTGEVIAGLAYHDPRMFSQWFQRVCALPNHLTVLNAGTVVVVVLGIGYLLGQIYDRRAFVLLLWLGLGIVPPILSDEPTTRRLALAFPAMYAIAGVMLAGAVGVVRTRASRWLGDVTAALFSVAVAGIAWTNLASHFRISTGPVWVTSLAHFTAPLLRGSDAVLHNLESGIAKVVLLSNLDAFLDSPPCYNEVRDADWLKTALNLPCNFDGYAYQLTMPPARRAVLRERYRPRRITFLLEETSYSQPQVALLQSLFPAADVRHTRFMQDQRGLVSLTVDIADVEALRAPLVWVSPDAGESPGLETGLLNGVTLRRGDGPGADTTAGAGIVVRGGLFLERDGWYRFQVGADCADAQLTVDGGVSTPADTRPMLAGVHPFEITLPSLIACRLPLQLLTESADHPGKTPAPPAAFVSPLVAALPHARAESVVPYEGYGEFAAVAHWTGGGIDFGIDAQGHVMVLVLEEGAYRVQRFGRDGHEQSRWTPPIRPGAVARAMAVDGDGTTAIAADAYVLLRDATGHETTWRPVWDALPTDIAFAPGGQLLLAVPSRNAIAVFNRDGMLQGELTRFEGGPGRLTQPQSVSVSPEGNLLVTQNDGQVLFFGIGDDLLHPTFLGSFNAAFSHLPIAARGAAFDGPGRLLIPDVTARTSLVYDTQGQRLMAAQPGRDLSTKGFGGALRFAATADGLYAMDNAHVWKLAR